MTLLTPTAVRAGGTVYAALHRPARPGRDEPVGAELDLARRPVTWVPRLIDGRLHRVTGRVEWHGIPEAAEVVALWTLAAGGALVDLFDIPPARAGASISIGSLRSPAPVALTASIAGLELPDPETGRYAPKIR